MLSPRPYSSETPDAALVSSYLTPAAALYVRNHSPVPDVAWPDGETREAAALAHEVEFSTRGDDAEATTLSIQELERRFGRATITSVIQCAGNRAVEDIAATGPSGFSNTPYEKISHGMVGNATWSGARARV